MKQSTPKLWVASAVGLVILLVARAAVNPLSQPPEVELGEDFDSLSVTTRNIDQWFETRWNEEGLAPSSPAGDLLVLRRLSLALHGTTPSLQEIREFEQDQEPDRLARWTRRLLEDRRFADYFAERFARAFVGIEEGQFVIYRRDRFVAWLSEQLGENRPFDEIARQMISENGFSTGKPASNFVAATVNEGSIDPNRLAARFVRTLLGQRMDCAQCHDHPFDQWTQDQYEGLAAFFGQTRLSLAGIGEDEDWEFKIPEKANPEKTRTITPAVPFNPEWLPSEGNRRERLAAWVTHPSNRRFERAIANRVWGLMFGRPLIDPVDNIGNPPESPDVLDLLGRDFRENGYNLRRLIEVIAQSRPFRLDSTHYTTEEKTWDRLETEWAVFPMTRLRPEQMIGSMLQASLTTTIDQRSNLLVRTIRFFRERDFVEEYGDPGEQELEFQPGTIPQSLLRMNGRLTGELIDPNPFIGPGHLVRLAETPEDIANCAFLMCLTRRPEPEELELVTKDLAERKQRAPVVEDLFWSLFNTSEFCWNH